MDYRNNTDRGYGRPLWQWIVIYAVIGLIIYGLIYYFIFAGRSGTQSLTGETVPQTQNPIY